MNIDTIKLASDAATELMGSNRVDAGIAVNECLHELKRLQALLKGSIPICPQCRAAMRPVSYCGYYESFDHWQCDCDEISGAVKFRGQFA